MYITKHTLKDLEFNEVLTQLQDYAVTRKGKDKIALIQPIRTHDVLVKTLGKTDEYLKSYTHNNKIPGHQFNAIDKSLHLLGIENTFIEGEKLLDIRQMVETVLLLHGFFKTFKLIYPLMYETAQMLPLHPEI
ncbi:MAG: DNA mismatch repair protein MutS, partial [Flavobacteriia bacterium]